MRLVQWLAPKRDKKILLLRYFKAKTQAEVSSALGISQVQVSRIEKRILNDMREKFLQEASFS
jgi:RNA polymerase sporulation-specific sigma factor